MRCTQTEPFSAHLNLCKCLPDGSDGLDEEDDCASLDVGDALNSAIFTDFRLLVTDNSSEFFMFLHTIRS